MLGESKEFVKCLLNLQFFDFNQAVKNNKAC